MPIHVTRTDTCQAPVETAFAYVADYRNVPQWLFGMHKFEPVGDKDYGLGATFDAEVHLGAHIHTRIRVDDWVENELISFDSIDGVKVETRWFFTPEGADRTIIRGDVPLKLPFGPAGKLMGRVVEPAVKKAVEHSSEALARQIEEYAGRG